MSTARTPQPKPAIRLLRFPARARPTIARAELQALFDNIEALANYDAERGSDGVPFIESVVRNLLIRLEE